MHTFSRVDICFFCMSVSHVYLRHDVPRLYGETLTPVFELVPTTLFGFVFLFLRLQNNQPNTLVVLLNLVQIEEPESVVRMPFLVSSDMGAYVLPPLSHPHILPCLFTLLLA